MTDHDISRVPPHSEDAEKALIGAVLIENETFDAAASRVEAADFYVQRHAQIFEAISTLHGKLRPIDVLTLRDELQRMKVLEACGGDDYIASLYEFVPSAENIIHYSERVLELSILRHLATTCSQIRGEVFDPQNEPSDIINGVQKKIDEITDRQIHEKSGSIKDVIQEVFTDLQSKEDTSTGIESPWRGLNELTNGFKPGELIIVAARPSVGKSLCAMQIAMHAALEEGVGAAIFTLEMDRKEVAMRMLCSLSGVEYWKLRKKQFLSDADFAKLVPAADRLSKTQIIIDDTPGLGLYQLRSKARRHVKREGVKIIIVDYLQLMDTDDKRGKGEVSREQQVSKLSRKLKQLARDLEVPVVVLSQLNRQVENRPGGDFRPRLSDIRESGAVEQDADVVMFIFRRDMYPNCDDADKGKAKIIVAKQRNGSTGDVDLVFRGEHMRFDTADHDYTSAGAMQPKPPDPMAEHHKRHWQDR